jgi:hypothetical protein
MAAMMSRAFVFSPLAIRPFGMFAEPGDFEESVSAGAAAGG